MSKINLVRSKDRTERYKNKVVGEWERLYSQNWWRTVAQVGSPERNIELAKREMPVFLDPFKKDVEKLHSDPDYGKRVSMSKDMYKHSPVAAYLDKELNQCVALDYGCGSLARYTVPLSKRFKKVYAIDACPKAIEICKTYVGKIENIEVIQNDGTNVSDIPDESVDFVFSNLVFQHIGNKEIMFDLLVDINRVLKRPGVIRALFWTERQKDDHEGAYEGYGCDPEDFKSMFQAAGFEVDTMTHHHPILWATLVKPAPNI